MQIRLCKLQAMQVPRRKPIYAFMIKVLTPRNMSPSVALGGLVWSSG
jgi:hypothetical protein